MKKKYEEIKNIKITKETEDTYKKTIKGFDAKTCPKPEKYDWEERDFHGWHDLFNATLMNHDEQWENIFKEIERIDKVIKDKEKEHLMIDLNFEEDMMKKVARLLYLNLLTYTKGDAHVKIVAGGTEEVIDGYRFIVMKCKNATIRTLIDKRHKAMSPDGAK